MDLKVIGAGFGRTGTMSLKVALEELGFGPCYHMFEVDENPKHAEVWDAAARGEPVDLKGLLEDYGSIVDWPGCTFYKELMEAYPGAKVVLSVRDPDRWYESARDTIYLMPRLISASRIVAANFFLVGLLIRPFGRITRMADNVIWNGTFDGRFEDRQHAVSVFNLHNEAVKRSVPEDRLLVYEVGEGWEPLCEFLNVEAPENKPFPRLNDAKTFKNMVRNRLLLAGSVPPAAFLIASTLLYLLARKRRWFGGP
ncbi:MAG: sulfotransferase family protein [Rubrobacteraceae bacterium]